MANINWNEVGNFVGGLGMSLFGGNNGAQQMLANSKSLANHNAKLNYKYNQRYAENAPTWNRTGLESAGYNPNLPFLGSGSGMGSASSFSSAPVAGSYDYNAQATNALGLGKLVSDIRLATSQAKNLDSQTENTKTQTLAQLIKNKFLPERERADIAKIVSEKVRNEAEAESSLSNAKSNAENVEINRLNAKTNVGKALFASLLGSLGLGFGLKKVPNAKTIKEVGNLIKVAPQIIRL